jgi:hypothetical protein
MRWSLKIVVLGVLIVVLFVFVSPTLNLEPTAMRAWRAALMLAFFLSNILRIMTGRASQLLRPLSSVDSRETPPLIRLSLTSSCPLLCQVAITLPYTRENANGANRCPR